MCGRATLTTPGEELAEAFGLSEVPALAPRFNLAPTQPMAVIRAGRTRRIELLRWGLVPFWANDTKDGARHINARGETLFDKPVFREAARARRCLVIVDGFYEWKGEASRKHKQPFFVRRADGKPFALAGLWDRWLSRDPGPPQALETCAIVTVPPVSTIASLHDRMPLVLDPDQYDRWLDANVTKPEDLAEILKRAPRAELVVVPVSTRVNDVRNDDPSCIAPAEQATLPSS
jgi:putative SOS response-associated peptidase YedK